MPAASTTLPHFTYSSRMIRAYSCGVVPTVSTPIAVMRALKPGAAMMSAVARCSVSITSGGVPAGGTSPPPGPTPTPGEPAPPTVGPARARGGARAARRGERVELAFPDQRQQRVDRADKDVDAAGQHIGN